MSPQLVYRADAPSSMYDPKITIPGWQIDGHRIRVADNHYPSNFGRPQAPGAGERYNRLSYTLEISRPWGAYLFRMLVPILVVLLSTFAVFFLDPGYVDSRIGIAITALLSAVALHLTVSADLPQVGYIRLIDKVYNLAYLIIFATLAETVAVIRLRDAGRVERAHHYDRVFLTILPTATALGLIILVATR